MPALVFSSIERVSVTFFLFSDSSLYGHLGCLPFAQIIRGRTQVPRNRVHPGDVSTVSTVDPVQGSGNMFPLETSA